MALFGGNPDKIRNFGTLGGGLLLAATGNPLGLLLPHLYASGLERSAKRKRVEEGEQEVQSAFTDPIFANQNPGQTPNLSQQIFGGPSGPAYQPATMDQRMGIGQNAAIRANPGAMQEMLLKRATEQPKYETPFNIIDMQDPKSVPRAVTPQIFDALEKQQPGRFARFGDVTPQRTTTPSTKGVLDRAAKIQRFATEEEIAASNGNLVPIPNGMKLQSGPDGLTFTMGDASGDSGGLTPPVQTGLQNSILQADDALARLGSIKSKFKPEYQQLGTRWGNMLSNVKEKAGFQLDPTDQAQLTEFSSFKRDAAANVNQTIKDMSGATISTQEAPRLMQQMPVAGQGLLDGDGPTEFMSKLNGSIDSIKSAKARHAYALANKLTKEQMFGIPLDSIPSMIDKRGDQYLSELKTQNPTLDDATLREMVKNRLRQDFGLQ
jgi:hypothetical protein